VTVEERIKAQKLDPNYEKQMQKTLAKTGKSKSMTKTTKAS
jgi:hypothetical protein